MQIDFDAKITDLDGKPLKEGDKDVTLSTIACGALLANFPDEQNLAGEEKAKRFGLAIKASGGGKQDISPADVTLLQKLIGKAFSPLVVGRAYEILDPKPEVLVRIPSVQRKRLHDASLS